MIEGRQENGEQGQERNPLASRRKRGQPLFLFGALGIEMTYGLQSLE